MAIIVFGEKNGKKTMVILNKKHGILVVFDLKMGKFHLPVWKTGGLGEKGKNVFVNFLA